MKIGDRCFKRFDAFKRWRKSRVNCQLSHNSGSLASIRSVEEQSALSNLLGTNDAWIGLNDIDSEGFYVWADSSPFAYVTWTLAEKKNSSMKISHSCVALNGEEYLVSNCVEKKQSVCVIPAFTGKSKLHYHSYHNLVPSFTSLVCFNKVDTCHEVATCTNTLSACKGSSIVYRSLIHIVY